MRNLTFAKNKKAQAGNVIAGVLGAVVLLVALAITLSVGSDILTDVRSDQVVNTFAYNASTGGLEGIDKVSDFQDTIGLVVAASAVIAIVLAAFAFAARRR